eukprot:11333857-Karenia_brevis.AAC.1
MKKRGPSVQPAGKKCTLAKTRRADQEPHCRNTKETELPGCKASGTGYSRRVTSLACTHRRVRPL